MKLAKFLLAAICFMAAQAAFAWGADGHRIVGEVADQDLTPRTRMAVSKLMDGADSLSSVATWMDEVRGEHQYAYLKPWHFLNTEVCDPKVSPCRDGNCAPSRINWAIGELKSGDQARQAMGLRVLVHLVGDIHQPLHAADNEDGGGNGVTISNRRCGRYGCELHAYWDSTLVKETMRGVKRATIGATFASYARLPANDSMDPNEWAKESFVLAQKVAYHFNGFACGQRGDVELSPDYDQAALSTVRTQLSVAGHRLARVLNSVFDR